MGWREETQTRPFAELASRWACELTYDAIPREVRHAALAQRASTLGAAVWSLSHPAGDSISESTRRQYESNVSQQVGESTATFLGGEQLSPEGAAYGNAALSMALDFDNTVLGGHIGHSAVFVPMAYAEATGADQECALIAQVAANEIAARVASAAAVGPFRGQQTAYVHSIAAVVARAIVEDDDRETLQNALGISLGGPPWSLEAPFFGGDAKYWLASEPIRTGLSAIESARSGQRGHGAVVTTEDGFLDSFATIPVEEFLGGLGVRWHTRAVTVKDVPGCAYVTAPVEAALQIAAHERFDPSDIATVTVKGSLFATEVDDRASPYLDGPDSPVSALTFTVPYNVAVALLDGEHTPRQLTPERVEDEQVWELANHVELQHDESLTLDALASEVPLGAMLRRVGLAVVPYSAKAVGPRTALANLPTLLKLSRKRPLLSDLSKADKRMGARVTVETTDNFQYVAEVTHPTGFAGQPLEDIEAVAREKYKDALMALGCERERAKSLVSAFTAVERDESVSLRELPVSNQASDHRE